MLTLIFYSLEDIVETELVMQMHNFTGCSKLHSAIITVPLMYSVLGVITAPLLFFFKPNKEQIKKIFPYAALWLFSQMTLLICFGILRPVFGNIVQSSRGLFSVAFGIIACRLNWDVMEFCNERKMWVRRGIAALMMTGGIICFSFGKIIG